MAELGDSGRRRQPLGGWRDTDPLPLPIEPWAAGLDAVTEENDRSGELGRGELGSKREILSLAVHAIATPAVE